MVVSRTVWPQIFAAMWGGNPDRKASVTKMSPEVMGPPFQGFTGDGDPRGL